MKAEQLDVEVLILANATLGEGPSWDVRRQQLLWVDIGRKSIHRSNLSTGEDEEVAYKDMVSAIVPWGDDGYLLTQSTGFWHLPEFGESPVLRASYDAERSNDGKVDGLGRMWLGTIGANPREGSGSLYRLEPDGTVKTILPHTKLANGIAFSADLKKSYFVDTGTNKINVLDLDEDGSLIQMRTLVDCSGFSGRPDGMAIDTDGCLWVAFIYEPYIRRFTPDGELDRVIELPTKLPTSVAFGGPNLDMLCITTARAFLPEEELAKQPLSGSILGVNVGAQGVAEIPYGGRF
jgi:sugar lactone lactonase YvrE